MQSAIAQDIWFGPRSQHPELMSLFEPDAPWQQAAAHVKAFEISDPLAYSAPEADLVRMFADLRRRNIDLVVGLLALSGRGPGHCGDRVEGYGAPGGPYTIAHRLKSLGIEPRFFSLDGPLFFGHAFNRERGAFGCHMSTAEVAQDVAAKVKQIRTVFPHVAIGDVEPVVVLPDQELEEWLDSFEAMTGTKLAFLRLDMDWKAQWRDRMPSLLRLLRRKGVPLQVIYNGSGQDNSDEEWMAQAVENFKSFETNVSPPPAAVMIQSWNPHPTHLLPEANPLTLTALINRYVEWRQSGR